MADDREGRGRPLKPPPGKRGARLSQEERALWEHTAASLQPIKGKKGRVHAALEDSDGEPTPSKRETAKPAPPKKPSGVAPSPPPAAKITLPPPAPGANRAGAAQGAQAQFRTHRDRRAHRPARHAPERGARGAAPVPQARLCRGQALGAGDHRQGRAGAHGARRADERDGIERGVLRRNVPRWLAEPELAGIVIGFTTAAVNHGGEGALYVHLRRKDRSG